MKSPLYDLWHSMVARCYDPRQVSYPYYGAKGITVCREWRNSFHTFRRDMSPRPEGTSLDRIDPTQGYSKANCRWATITEQNNNKSDTRHITFNGKTMNMTAWAREIGTSPAALHHRIAKMGMAIEDALTIPVKRGNRKCSMSK